jgi:hypothetical protein
MLGHVFGSGAHDRQVLRPLPIAIFFLPDFFFSQRVSYERDDYMGP